MVIKEIIDTTKDYRVAHEGNIPLNIVLILDNIRSIFNVGAIFRTAIGFGLHSVYLCGITPTPENIKLRKTSLGAENKLIWQKNNNCVDQCQLLKEQ